MVRILVDSAADYQMEELKEKQIDLIPLHIHFGEDSFVEGINLGRDELYEKIERGDGFPSTSQPSPQDFADVFEEAKRNGDEVVCILISSALSGTYSCAHLAKGMVDYDKIYLVDSLTVTYCIRLMAEHACTLRAEGRSGEEIYQAMENMKSKVKALAALDTLDYLHRGGRLNKATAMIGELANLKPVVTVTPEGKVEMIGKCLGGNKASAFVMRQLKERKVDTRFPMITIYTYGTENCAKLEERLKKEGYESTQRLQIGATIGTHVGPGAYGVIFVEE